jgi:hypothetical protein
MGGLRMRLIILACAMLATSLLAGCGSSSTESRSAEVDPPSKVRPVNPDLLSTDGELFPFSVHYGVCTRYKGIWRTTFHSGPLNPHEPTGGEITAAGGINLKISVGKFGLFPGTVLKDVAATSPSRRIQIGRDRLDSFVLVSDFENAGNNRVSINYDEKDADAEAAAIRLANAVVACHVSAVPTNGPTAQ